MAGKIIKKTGRFLLYFMGVILLLLIMLYYSLRMPAFQTWVSNRAGWYFSKQWGTTVKVEGVDIEFWKKVVLEGVYIEDQHQDTLLYAQKLKLDIGRLELDSQIVHVNDILLQNATVKLKQYRGDSVLNFQFLIDEFASKDTVKVDSTLWDLGIKGLTLDNIRFSYRNENDLTPSYGINFSNLKADYVNGKIADIGFAGDTVFCDIQTFSLVEKSGFILKKLSAKASISPVQLKMDGLKVQCNESSISTDLTFQYESFRDFNDFVENIKIRSEFKSSNIEMKDVAFFTDALHGIEKKIFLDGTVSGKISDLKGRNMVLAVGNETTYKGNFDMIGLPNIDQTFMSFDARDLRTSKAGIESIPLPPFNEKHFIELPDNVALFGNIKFKGNFSGFYNDFVSYGKFSTALGNISTDISLKEDTVTGNPEYHGKFTCTDFNLGRFFESEKYLGRISMNAIVNGKGFKKATAVTTVEGKVSSLEFNGYNYHNMDLRGKFAKNIFDGFLAVKDENLIMEFNGDMDFSKSPTQMNFTTSVDKANLTALKFVRSEESIGIIADISVNAVGNNPDDVTGTMQLSKMAYIKGTERFKFQDVTLSISEKGSIKTLDLNSAIADVHVNGRFKPMDIASSVNDFLGNYLPSYISGREGHTDKKNGKKKSTGYNQQFTFDVQLKSTSVVTRAFFPSLVIGTPVSVQGSFDEAQSDLLLKSTLPALTYGSTRFKTCSVNMATESGQLSFDVRCQRLLLSDSVWIDSIQATSSLARDTANFRLRWHNNTTLRYEGEVPGYLAFTEKPKIKLKLLPSEITIADSTWKLNKDNEIVIDSSFVSVKSLEFTCNDQQVRLEGNISEVKGDQLYLMLNSFSLANFNTYLRGTEFSVYGTISGNTSIGNIYDKPLFGSSIDIKALRLNKQLIGDGNLVSVYDSKKDIVNFNGGFDRGGGENLKFAGNYYPSKKENSLEVDAEMHAFRLEFFNPFIRDNFENLKGYASAEMKITGTPSKPLLNGKVNTHVENVHVNYLRTNYHFDGDITMEPNSFDFANLVVLDPNNNRAEIVNGKIFHDNFKNFQFDVDINATKFMALNTTEKDNSIYYGKVFTTGIVNVFGFLDHINLSATIKTDRAKNPLGKYEYSQIFIPLSGSEEVGENSFITFVKKDTAAKQEKYKVTTSGFTMDFKLQATPDAQAQLIFDEKVGDIIKANGSGDIRMVINEYGDFKMYGDYEVEEGDYLFTLKNVVNKRFRLEKGGIIRWSGSPEDAEIDMSAIYELRTSLKPLFPEVLNDPNAKDKNLEVINKRHPVDCVMKLTGKLMEPDIAFDIVLPTVDDFTRQQAYDKFRNSESETNKQVFSLMFTNSFSPPAGQQQDNSGPGAGTVTSTEVLSNQLSNWLSQISNEFDVGVHYRASDEVNKDQVELALSTQLFNDKMTIDGSVANNANTTTGNTADVVGDINVDYKLTEDGKFRAKAYNKANEGDVLNTQKGPYTQGVGVFYREEFETIGELFRRYLSKLKKKNT